MSREKLAELKPELKDKLIEILTEQWHTRAEIFNKLPRFKSTEEVRAINEFIEAEVKAGNIIKRIKGSRILYGIFEDYKEETNINTNGNSDIGRINEASKKNINDTKYRVKIGKTIYVDQEYKKPNKVEKKVIKEKKEDNFLIIIDGNEDFKLKAEHHDWEGIGKKDDPYIIQNLSFDGESGINGLNIKNTDLYFIIYDCTFRNCKKYGILLENVKNGVMKQNRVVLNKENGIVIKNSEDIVIENNYILNNQSGITVIDSIRIIIQKNEANTNPQFGIKLINSADISIKNNITSNNGVGIALEFSNNNIIENNELKSNKNYGIHLNTSSDNQIIKNLVLNNNSGIELLSSSDNIISKNQIKYSRQDGISLFESIGNSIEENTTINNKCGIYLDRCTGNIIKSNTIKPNFEETIYMFESFKNEIY